MRASGTGPDGGAAHPVDDGQGLRRRHGAELLQAPHEALERHGVGPAHRDHGVGGGEAGEGRLVAAGRGRVVAELLVVLEAEAAVDDDERHEGAAELEHPLERRRPHLGPPLGLGQAGQHPQSGQHLRGRGRRGPAGRACPARPHGRPPRCREPRRAGRGSGRRSRRRCRRRRGAPRRRGRRPRRRASSPRWCDRAHPSGPRRRRSGPRSGGVAAARSAASSSSPCAAPIDARRPALSPRPRRRAEPHRGRQPSTRRGRRSSTAPVTC